MTMCALVSHPDRSAIFSYCSSFSIKKKVSPSAHTCFLPSTGEPLYVTSPVVGRQQEADHTPYNDLHIDSSIAWRRALHSTTLQYRTTTACLNLLATVESMSFDRLFTWPTSITTRYHQASHARSTIHHHTGREGSVTVYPRARQSSEKCNFVGERRHNFCCSCKLCQSTDSIFPSTYHSHPVRHRRNSDPALVRTFLTGNPSQGFSEDLHHYPSTTRASYTATVPKST